MISVHRQTMSSNTQVTRRLRVYLNTGLRFKVDKNLTSQQASRTNDRVTHFMSIRSLAAGQVRKINMVAV